MKRIFVNGGRKLDGTINISGAKNAALPIIAACLLSEKGKMRLLNVPMVDDVVVLGEILSKLGMSVNFSKDKMLINTSNVRDYILPVAESKKMRASMLLAGPLLARLGQVMITEPGGCVIGKRPIDMHLDCFKAMGASVERANSEYIKIDAPVLKGKKISLRFPSVGVTENLIMVSCLAKGKTIIENAAKEPEIVDLANFLISMGAKIRGHGSSVIKIDGVEELTSTEYKIMPDRIETGTYIVAAAITHGTVLLKKADLSLLVAVESKLREAGVKIERSDEGLQVTSKKTLSSANIVTDVYPGFPTDMQSIITALFSIAIGKSTIKETIFEHRFNHVSELKKMGANINTVDDTLFIKGVKKLRGAHVKALDLRSGASLLLAGLAAEGETVITGVNHILRGYENPIGKLKKVGAEISLREP